MIDQKSSVEIMRQRISTGFPDGDRATTTIPLKEMPMRVNIDELRPSRVLPRLKKNPMYEDIKESIRKKGLDQAPPITKIPGEDGYVISDGGNTRLEILKELYEETGDKRLYTINFIFRQWEYEIISIVFHLTENGLRADFTFIERSLGISRSKALYEDELKKSLSSRELSELLKNNGYPISHTLISKMLNTVEYLYPHIPEILKSGLSRNQIEKILMLRSICNEIYKKTKKYDNDTAFVEGFNLILTEFDYEPEVYSYERLQDEMFGYFAKLLGISYQIFEFELDEKNNKGIKKNDTTRDSIPLKKQDEPIEKPAENNENSSEQSNISIKDQLDEDEPTEIDSTKSSYTVSPSGEITMDKDVDVNSVIEDVIKNTDLTKINPYAYSISANLNTYEKTERTPILDIWKLPEDATNYEYIFRDIAGHVLDIFDELRINKKTFAFSIDDNDKSKLPIIAFNQLTIEDEADPKKCIAYKLLSSLLIKQTVEPISLYCLITEFNDFVVIKLLHIIRLFRVYNVFFKKLH